jgi:hypothetical protein
LEKFGGLPPAHRQQSRREHGTQLSVIDKNYVAWSNKPYSPPVRRPLANAAVVIVATIISFVCCELALRSLYPGAALGAGKDLDWFRTPGTEVATTMVADAEIGFRPRLNGEKYDAYGIRKELRVNAAAAIDARKVLFVGDSVTARGRIINALRQQLGDPAGEFLNGGVESFNLIQEVEFFLRFQSERGIDHIIHQVHGNDLQATPIAFRDEHGALNVYSLNAPKHWVNEWLFRHSYVYRLALAAVVARRTAATTFIEARDSFSRMAGFAASRGIHYDVVLFPVLLPSGKLSASERQDWQLLDQACRDVVKHCISLLPVLDRMLDEGRPVQETVGDMWHPNDSFAAEAATQIIEALALRQRTRGAGAADAGARNK